MNDFFKENTIFLMSVLLLGVLTVGSVQLSNGASARNESQYVSATTTADTLLATSPIGQESSSALSATQSTVPRETATETSLPTPHATLNPVIPTTPVRSRQLNERYEDD